MKADNQKSKVIIVVGFLGSGKTTLIESILKAPQLNKKVAVIQNEFSSNMGLETALMKDAEGNDIQDFYEMPNGCICCASKSDLIVTLDSLLEKKRDIDYILVEANGLSEPSSLVKTFWLDEGLGSKVEYHQTIAVIDAKNFKLKLQNNEYIETKEKELTTESQLLQDQLIFADKILINKIDLLDKEQQQDQLDYVKHCINEVNPHAEITETTYSKIPLEYLIQKNEEKQKQILPTEYKCCSLKEKHDHSHKLIEEIQSIYISLSTSQPLDRIDFERFIGELLWEKPNEIHIMRCKGIFIALNDDDKLSQYMLQGVEDVFELREISGNSINYDDQFNHKFLFVGKNIIEEVIKKNIELCLMKK